MLKFILTVLVLLPAIASATIDESTLDPRHQAAIEAAIQNSCGLSGHMIQVEHFERPVRIDSGIIDYTFTTVVVVRVGIDQYNYDEHRVAVESEYSDSYDHKLRDWGTYSVKSVFLTNRRCL
jgi:hypothetical protein